MSDTLFSKAITDGSGSAIFSESAIVDAMTRFEVSLASAQAQCGIVPDAAAQAIDRAASTFSVDAAQLAIDALQSASLAVPFVKALTQHVAMLDQAAAGYLHYGASTQDVIDTAMVLCTKRALQVIDESLTRATSALDHLAIEHAQTPMLARTLMQPAGVTTVGHTLLQWIDALTRGRERIKSASAAALCVSLGGPFGQLSAFGDQGPRVRAALASALGLRDPDFVWHAFRDDWITLAAAMATTCAKLQKIARDISLCAQPEVDEMRESHVPGKGASSSMPHKRNPVLTLRVLANAQPIPGYLSNLLAGMNQEHQRALGSWQSELGQWPRLCSAAVDTAVAFEALIHAIDINAPNCRKNIDRHKGLVFSVRLADCWSALIGKAEATRLVAKLCDEAIRTQKNLGVLALEAREQHASLQSMNAHDVEVLFDVDALATQLADQVRRRLS